MRIALVTDTYTPQVNGVTTVVVRIANVLREFGHDVAIVAPRYPGDASVDPAQLRIPSASFPPYPAIRLSLPQFAAVARFLDSFEPDVVVELEEFTDIIGRNFRQPEEGLGWDSSPSAHMWRTLIRPTRYL